MTEGASSSSEEAPGGPPQAQDAASGNTRPQAAPAAPSQRPSETRPGAQETVKQQSLYDRVTYDIEHDHKVRQEMRMGKRVGFYKLKGQLGTGNFSKVKVGVHLLTTGRLSLCSSFFPRVKLGFKYVSRVVMYVNTQGV